MASLPRFPIWIERHELGPRVWVFGRYRLHHGLVGLVMAVIGVALMAHDFKDRWAWIHTELTELI